MFIGFSNFIFPKRGCCFNEGRGREKYFFSWLEGGAAEIAKLFQGASDTARWKKILPALFS
nr:hypothetical protein [uncultured Anaeromusa sp.]